MLFDTRYNCYFKDMNELWELLIILYQYHCIYFFLLFILFLCLLFSLVPVTPPCPAPVSSLSTSCVSVAVSIPDGRGCERICLFAGNIQ